MSDQAEAREGRRPCGTEAAYRRHLRHGEEPDEPCRRAAVEAVERRRAIRELGDAEPPGDELPEVAALRAELARVRWVTEVHLSRRGLWDTEVGSDIRSGWNACDDGMIRVVARAGELTTQTAKRAIALARPGQPVVMVHNDTEVLVFSDDTPESAHSAWSKTWSIQR